MVRGSIIISTLLSNSFCHICRPLRNTDSRTAHTTSTANHATSVSSAPAYSIFFLKCRSIPPTHLSIVSTGDSFQHSESNQTSTTAPISQLHHLLTYPSPFAPQYYTPQLGTPPASFHQPAPFPHPSFTGLSTPYAHPTYYHAQPPLFQPHTAIQRPPQPANAQPPE